ncbi:DUF167 family protein [Roseiarcaceae bacterium H3SJ34-1]|nr:DUF167 family protein [Roseiarcaceae bacterium H3SJ34-1]
MTVRLTPKSSTDAIDGIAHLADDSAVVKARVRAPPENGKANTALVRLVADTLQVAKSAVTVKSGATGRTKVIAVTGDAQAMADRLARMFG